jgi:hypothetical protein
MMRWRLPWRRSVETLPGPFEAWRRANHKRRDPPSWPIFALLLLVAGGLYIIDATHKDDPRVYGRFAPTVTATATLYSLAIVDSGTGLSNAATLGGTPAGFATVMGKPITATNGRDTFMASLKGHPIEVDIDLDDGSDGARHVSSLAVFSLGNAEQWDDATAFALSSIFIPHDAQSVDRDEHTLRYISPGLAQVFPAGFFADAYGNTTPAGTFYLTCEDAYCVARLGR